MRKIVLTLALAAFSAASFAVTRDRVTGFYHLVPNEETRRFCRRHHIDLPTGRLVMRDDRSFKLTYSDDEGVERTAGTYDIEGGQVRFVIESGFGVGLPPELRLEESCLRSDRTEYARDEEVREVPVRPREEPRSRPQPRYESGRHSGSIEGIWRMVRGNGIDGNTKFVFSSDGTFRYVGDNSSSRGRYSLSDQGIELVWAEIDGQPVDRGANIHKCLPFSYSGDAFYVDDYRYERGR